MQQKAIPTSTETADVWIDASEVRRRCGSIAEVTLWRWRGKESLEFPKPKRVNGRLYWSAADIADWQARQDRERNAFPWEEGPADAMAG